MWLNVCSRLKPSMRFVRFAPFCPSGNIKRSPINSTSYAVRVRDVCDSDRFNV